MKPVERISPQEAFERQSAGYVYVDVRSESEYKEGHPKGAVNVPLLHQGAHNMEPNSDFLQVIKANFAKDAKLVLGCHSGGRSMRAAHMLLEEGYTEVLEQRAGWDGRRDPFGQLVEPGWARAALPVASGEPAGCSYAELKSKIR